MNGAKDGPVAKKDVSAGKVPPQPTRTSARLIKKPRRDFTLVTPPVSAPPPPKKASKQQEKQEKPATRSRIWETEDKNAFFEGLFEHGKKFNKLQEFIKQRNRQRTGTSKTKDQIRHFYYNTWHKISKYIDGTGSDGTMNDKNRFAFEMYCLVNYGELRRRVGGKLDDRKGQKLNELVYKGQTVIRVAGKTHRIKTPMCRALKKLNNIIEESKEEEQQRVPEKVILELRPRTNLTWERVQNIAQNPRLHITMPPGKRIGSVVEYLTRKWQLPRLKLKENMNLTEKPTEELRLYPPKDCQLHPFELKTISPPAVTPVLTLETYLENMRSVNSTEASGTPPTKKACRRNSEGGVDEAGHTDASAKSAETMSTTSKSVGSMKTDTSLDSTKSKSHSEGVPAAGSAGAVATALDVASQRVVDIDAIIPDELKNVLPTFGKTIVQPPPGAKETKGSSKGSSKNSCKKPYKPDPALEKYREGWTATNSGKFSAAEVYLLLGGPEKLVLEYEWVETTLEQPPMPEVAMLAARFSNMLRRLVHIANTEFTDTNRPKPNPVIAAAAAASAVNSPPSKCSCGAAINNNNTPPGRGGVRSPRVTGVNMRSPSTPKSIQPKPGPGVSTPKSSRIPMTIQNPAEQVSTLSPILPAPPSDGSTNSEDSPFRVPNGLPLRSQQQASKASPNTQADQNFLQQLSSINKSTELMFPSRRRKQNRAVRKPLVVQRSILPKQNTRQIMTLTLSQNGMFVPVAPTELMSGQVVPASTPVTIATAAAAAPVALATTQKSAAVLQTLPSQRPRPQIGSRIQMRPAPRMSTISQLNHQRALQAAALVQAATQSAKLKPPPELGVPPTSIQSMVPTQLSKNTSAPSKGGLLSLANTTTTATVTTQAVSAFLGKPLTASTTTRTITATTTALGASGPKPCSVALEDSLPSSLLDSSGVVGIDGLSNLTLPSIPDTSTDGDAPISALLDLSIPDSIGSKFDLGLENSSNSFSAFLNTSNLDGPGKDPNLAAAIDKSDTLRELRSVSPGKLLKTSTISLGGAGDSQWVPVDDFSLSNFLNSPLKKPSDCVAPQVILSEGSRDSLVTKFDVDSALQSMMNENSMDYSAKFADLAAQIAASAPTRGHDHL